MSPLKVAWVSFLSAPNDLFVEQICISAGISRDHLNKFNLISEEISLCRQVLAGKENSDALIGTPKALHQLVRAQLSDIPRVVVGCGALALVDIVVFRLLVFAAQLAHRSLEVEIKY